jgi:acetyltransferase-like isoleucine patch superfamily enzyme
MALLGRIKGGRIRSGVWYYIRYWFVRALTKVLPLKYVVGTPLLCVFYRMMGAKIGKNVFIGSTELGSFDLFEIGEGSCLGYESGYDGYWVEGGKMHLKKVKIGAGCVVGNRALVAPGATMGDFLLLGRPLPFGRGRDHAGGRGMVWLARAFRPQAHA